VESRALAHDPEKWVPVFRKDHAQIKEIERDDDSKKRHHALDMCEAFVTDPAASADALSDGLLPSAHRPLSNAAACELVK
jgi:hypothetical protein